MRKGSKSFNCELTGEPVAVVNLGLPVACLPEYVKRKTSGATDSGQPEELVVYHVFSDHLQSLTSVSVTGRLLYMDPLFKIT